MKWDWNLPEVLHFLWSFKGKKVHKIPQVWKEVTSAGLWSNLPPFFIPKRWHYTSCVMSKSYSKSSQDSRYEDSLARKSRSTQMNTKKNYVSLWWVCQFAELVNLSSYYKFTGYFQSKTEYKPTSSECSLFKTFNASLLLVVTVLP